MIGFPATGISGLGTVSVCGRNRVPLPAIGIMIFIYSSFQDCCTQSISIFSCTAESSGAPLGIIQRCCFNPVYTFVAGDYHLGDALARLDGLWFVRQVHDDTFYFTAIITVDGARRIEHRESAFGCKAAARTDLGFIATGQLDEQSRWDERPFERV